VAVLLLMGIRGGSAGKRRPTEAGSRWSDEDMRAFLGATSAAGVPYDIVLEVYASESGLDPAASSGSAWGLPQMIERTLRGVGWTNGGPAFGALSVAQQAPYIARLLKSQRNALGRVPRDAVDLYAVNFYPEAAKRGDDVLIVRDSKVAKERQAYSKNAGLDWDHKGWIDRNDLKRALDRAPKAWLKRAQDQARRLAA
jgi:hypothetical protein